MAPPGYIQACAVPSDGNPPYLYPMSAITKPSDTKPSSAKPLTPSAIPGVDDFSDTLRPTHFAYFGSDYLFRTNYDSELIFLQLPDTHPSCPEQWTKEDWNKRIVHGDDEIHVLATSGSKEAFILMVSRDKNRKDKWVYKDFAPGSKIPQHYLDIHAKQLVCELQEQVEAVKSSARTPSTIPSTGLPSRLWSDIRKRVVLSDIESIVKNTISQISVRCSSLNVRLH